MVRVEYERCLELMATRASQASRALIPMEFLSRLSHETPGWRFYLDDLLDRVLPDLRTLAERATEGRLPAVVDPAWYDLVVPALGKLRTYGDPHPSELTRILNGMNQCRTLLALFARDAKAFLSCVSSEDRASIGMVLESTGNRGGWLEALLAEPLEAGRQDLRERLAMVLQIESDWAVPKPRQITCPLVESIPLVSGSAFLLGTIAMLQVGASHPRVSPGESSDVTWNNDTATFLDSRSESALQNVARDACAAAQIWFRQMFPTKKIPSPGRFTLSFSDKTICYHGSSVGLAVGIGIATCLAELARRRLVPAAQSRWAFTGGLSLDGQLTPPARGSLDAKVRAVRHSPCSRLYTDPESARWIESELLPDAPANEDNGVLEILGVSTLEQAVGRIEEIRHKPPRRHWDLVKWAVTGAAVLFVLLVTWFLLVWSPTLPEPGALEWEISGEQRRTLTVRYSNRTLFRKEFPSGISKPVVGHLPPTTGLALIVGTCGDGPAPGHIWLHDLGSPKLSWALERPVGREIWKISLNPSSVYFPPSMRKTRPFDATQMTITDLDGDAWPEILVVSNMVARAPSVVLVVDQAGNVGPQYANYGNMDVIETGDFDTDGSTDVLIAAISNRPEGLFFSILDSNNWSNKFQESCQTAKWTLFIPIIPEICHIYEYPYFHGALTSIDLAEDRKTEFLLNINIGDRCPPPYDLRVTCDLQLLTLTAGDQLKTTMLKLLAEGRVDRDYSSDEFLEEWQAQFIWVPAGGPLIQQ